MSNAIPMLKLEKAQIRRFMPAAAFFGGFLWDSLTLVRIDQLFDNVLLFAYLILLGCIIILINLIERRKVRRKILIKFGKWYPFAMQFLFGGLFSAYVVFYFKSASLARPGLFLILLAALLVANEFLEKRMSNIFLQVSLYYMVTASFLIFFLPIVVRSIGFGVFLSACILSVLAAESVVFILSRKSVFHSRRELFITRSIPPVLCVIIIMFYIANWIPPVPLSLKASGIYHSVMKRAEGAHIEYILTFEKPPWYKPWVKSDSEFHYSEGDSVFCFTAVFATTDLTASIIHQWQMYDPGEGVWNTSDLIELPIRGGRDEGYRLYSFKEKIREGDWRVEIRLS
ncbi:DUF2914 domain-containing protein, partial [candidate division KSB1 bacterium]